MNNYYKLYSEIINECISWIIEREEHEYLVYRYHRILNDGVPSKYYWEHYNLYEKLVRKIFK